MSHMKQLMIQIQTNQEVGGGKTINRNTHRPPTLHSATDPIQDQPHNPIPYFSTKYFWTHGKFAHEGAD